MRQQGFNGDRFILDIAGNGGSTLLLATGPLRFCEGLESQLTSAGGPNALQGFEYQLPTSLSQDTGLCTFGPWILVPPPELMDIGDPQAKRGPFGIVIGNGPDTPGAGQTPLAATVLANLRAVTAGPTSIVISEYF